jgi:hypothetical protein
LVLFTTAPASRLLVTELFLTNGIQMRFFKGLGHNHNKYINVDGEYVVISSINWSNNSVTNNREAGAVVKSTNVASYLTQIFDYDWGNGEEPAGFVTPLVISYPSKGEVVYGTYQFGALFSVYNYTSGELYIDDSLKHTWTNPSSLETYTIDTTTYANGIHTIKIIGTPTSGPDVDIEYDFNIINADQWKLLISEVRYDATLEPNGEFFELYNGFNFDVYIGDWVVTDNEDDYSINSEAIIDSKGTLVFVRDGTTFTSEMNGLGLTNPEYDYLYTEVSLANSGDELILKAAGSIKDAVAWGSSSTTLVTPWTGTMNESVSLQREYADVDTDDCSEDFIALLPTPGTVNIYLPFTWPWSGFTIGITLATIIVFSGISYIYSRKRKK